MTSLVDAPARSEAVPSKQHESMGLGAGVRPDAMPEETT